MNKTIIQNLLDQYIIPEYSPIILLRESSDNKVFEIGKHDKKILRISKRLLKKDVQFEFDVISHFHKYKFPVAQWVKTKNNNIFSSNINGDMAILFDYIYGYHAIGNNNLLPRKEQARSAGNALGKMCEIGQSFSSTKPRNRNIFTELERAIKLKNHFINNFEGGDKFIREIIYFIRFGKHTISKTGLIHNDFRVSNVYFDKEDKINGIIDFDWCCMGPIIKDLALGILEWSFPDGKVEPDFGIFDAFLIGYNSASSIKVTKGTELYLWIQFAALSDSATYFCDRINSPRLNNRINSSFMYKKYSYFSTKLHSK